MPQVIRPKWIALTWRWRRATGIGSQTARDSVLGLLTFGLAAGCFKGTTWVLKQTETALDFAYLPPSLIIGLILVLLFFMLLVTNTVSALGALYMSSDLELLLSSPLKPIRFFGGKLVEIIILSSWMTGIFLLPVLFAFAAHFGPSWQYFAACVLALLPYFVIPAGVAVILATGITLIAPWIRRRELAVLFGLAIGALVWRLGTLIGTELHAGGAIDLSDIVRMVSFLSITNTRWAPAHWSSTVIGESLSSRGVDVLPYLTLLYSGALSILSAAYVVLRYCHFSAYSRSGMLMRSAKVASRSGRKRSERLLGAFSRPIRALVVKEYRLCMRDLTQVIQFVMLLGLCAMYVYMLSLQSLFESAIPAEQQRWWRIFLVCTNLCIEAFVITAMGTRLVFPSISREGRAYWVLENAPLQIRTILRVKFWFWFIPLALISSVVFTSVTLVMYGSLTAGLVKFVSNFVLSAALVSLGLGCGAYFAKFDWEHPSELIAGFGSLVYMVGAVMLIVFNLCGSGVLVYLRILRGLQPEFALRLNVLAILVLVFIYTVDLAIARWALRMGERALSRRQIG